MNTPNESAPAGGELQKLKAIVAAMRTRLDLVDYEIADYCDRLDSAIAALTPKATGGELRELSPAQIEQGWRDTFSVENPFCPCDLKSFGKAVRWALRQTPAIAPAGDEVHCLPCSDQIGKLADFILREVPGEPSQSQGAVDTAIRLLRERIPAAGNAVDDASRRTLEAVMALCDQIREESRQPLSQVSDTTACVKSNLRHWLRSPEHFAAALAAPQDGEADHG